MNGLEKTILFTAVLSTTMALKSFAQENKVIDDRDIAVSQSEPMEYPPLARTARVQGVVVIRVKLDRLERSWRQRHSQDIRC
jgi:outer membrane biosynthesis protein TonB